LVIGGPQLAAPIARRDRVFDVEQDRTVSDERETPLVGLENLDSELDRAAGGPATISERQSMRAIVAPATLRHIGLAT
jgi:hypothetical protein